MTDIAISVENLSKSYLVGHNTAQSERYTALRDVLSRNARNLARKTRDMFSGRAIVQGDEVEEFWALKDVSFEIKQGDRVGIIGRNGAGKSTLLKILSRITEPTTGRIKIVGRVASLLEVGTGFHPELTGRENIFLNGAILGMKRSEIERKFDEIVDFAEVEKFLDTPVKRYSSGMYVRLAFAVAAHLEPEILIVDEVLAVGDAQFQKKCLGKMENVSKDGRTIVFVSHNITAIESLCKSIIYLKSGILYKSGTTRELINEYLSDIEGVNASENYVEMCLSENIYLRRLSITPNPINSGECAKFDIQLRMNASIKLKDISILFYSLLGGRVAILDLRNAEGNDYMANEDDLLDLNGRIASLPFVEGIYNLGLFINSTEGVGNFLNLRTLNVLPRREKNSIVIPYPASARGVVNLNFNFDN